MVETADIAAIPLPRGCESLTEKITANEHHIVAVNGAARLRLCLRMAPAHSADRLIIPRDSSAVIRLAAAIRFERVTRGARLTPDRAASPSAYRRSRLAQLLGIHDAWAAGASPRDLAFGLVFLRQLPLGGATWKGSGERRHTLRLIADARRMVASGYRRLLLHD